MEEKSAQREIKGADTKARSQRLILLTRLDKTRVLVCIESIKYLEANPDTVVTFLNGDTLIVRETLAEIANEVRQFKAEVAAAATRMSTAP
jgi:flagellar protein FlbD